ncbi:YjgF-like protein protein [Deinococcus geothermalis DSM 11300]|uniref:YjgF-like protein protein n=2 Tax=Deinococcaceae TaxID=183710 RepID=Q1J1V1_DEIGD|nr:YjgF-like protein protein [Deinococcus geothermalis DSM 11300]
MTLAPVTVEPMKEIVQTPEAPAAIGPYSQATRFGNLVITSGQIPLRPDGTLVEGGIEAQTRQVLDNLSAVLAAAGTDLSRVVKTTVFLADMNEFAAMNAVYAEYFQAPYPARSTVQVARLPRDVRVEIEVMAEWH